MDDPSRRIGEHARVKDFDEVGVLTDALSHDDARTLEGGLIRRRLENSGIPNPLSIEDQLSDAGLLNKNRGRIEDRRWVGTPKYSKIKAQNERTILKPKKLEDYSLWQFLV